MENAQKQKIEEVLLSQGIYVGPTVGISMLPLLKTRRDTVVIKPKTQRLKRLDVALYKRGNAYVLHRVLEVKEWGYIIRGDNCYSDEKIPEEAVIGVLTEFFRKGKHIFSNDPTYIQYAERRIKTYKIRRFFVFLRLRIVGIAKIILKPLMPKKK